MPEINPPIFSSWVELAVILVMLTATWLGMIALLRGLSNQINAFRKWNEDSRKADREWMEASLERILQGQGVLGKEHEDVMTLLKQETEVISSSLKDERREHATDHRAIGDKLGRLIGRVDVLIAKCDELIRSK